MLETARAILERGDAVLIFPEGTRIRPGALGRPRRGVGRLALETGAPVVPVAIIGTEAIRKGWRIRPHKVRIRVGRPLTFPQVENASPQLAAAVTDRIWPNVMLQWEWLGGLPPLRRAAVIGAGSWGTAVAVMLARAGLEVDLGCRTARAGRLADRALRRNERYLDGIELPENVNVMRAAELEPSRHDLVVFAVPAAHLPAAVAAHGGADRAAQRRARVRQGPRAAARHAARPPTSPSASRPGPSARSAAPRTPRPRSTPAPRSCSPRPTPRSPARWPTRCDAAGFDVAVTHRHHRRRAGRLRQERRRARGRRRRPARGPTPPAPPPARCSPRSTPTRAAPARAPRRSPASPARATSWRPCSPAARATAARASCSPRAWPRGDIGAALGQTAEAVDTVPLLAARVRDVGGRRAGAGRARGDDRGPGGAGALGGLAHRARSPPCGATRPRPPSAPRG